MNNFFTTFFNEKNLDFQYYTVNSPNGTPNLIPSTVVIDAIKNTKGQEAVKIKDMLIKIDFFNGDVHNYLQHLAQALAKDLDF
jgi:hypothetical protein|tara:strand:- start:36 stop:284 length:249 start_codon:yes stop_codon:yes gene_type:complete